MMNFIVKQCSFVQAAADPARMERIGRVVTLSLCEASGPNEEIFFKHQAKEEDFMLRPDWLTQLDTPCQIKGGASGPVGKHAGHALFERAIGTGRYRDYEKEGGGSSVNRDQKKTPGPSRRALNAAEEAGH